jgi:hypothetical protein
MSGKTEDPARYTIKKLDDFLIKVNFSPAKGGEKNKNPWNAWDGLTLTLES